MRPMPVRVWSSIRPIATTVCLPAGFPSGHRAWPARGEGTLSDRRGAQDSTAFESRAGNRMEESLCRRGLYDCTRPGLDLDGFDRHAQVFTGWCL
jgi:hypothetical protein